MNFWQKLQKPIIGLSPMDGVSDAAFRFITAKYGKPDVITTEFISIDGIAHGAKNLFNDFLYHEIERPVVAQVFGTEPDLFYQAAQIICDLGFDGMDINMGCPAKSVSTRGAGAGLIRTPEKALEIVRSSKKGVEDYLEKGLKLQNSKVIKEVEATKSRLYELGVELKPKKTPIPVSVKTRIGYDKDIAKEWMTTLLQSKPASIAVHGRTLKQMYQGQADWSALKTASEVIYNYNNTISENERITIILNGDVNTPLVAKQRLEEIEASGLYIGRGSYGNPWIFSDIKDFLATGKYTEERELELRAKVAVEHANLHFQIKGEKGFVQMRKHLAWYLKSFHGASQLRAKLVRASSPEEVETILREDGIAF